MTSGCYFCGSDVDIEEHHIVPQRFEGSDKESNTVDLCHDCHWKLERLYNKEFWEAIGVEDPRATWESHVKCQVHGCMEQATGQHFVKHGVLVYRCDQHAPDSDDDEERILEAGNDEEANEPETGGWLDQLEKHRKERKSTGTANHLEYVLNNLLNGRPVEPEKLHNAVGGGRVEEIRVVEKSEDGRVTGFRALRGNSRYAARFEEEDGEWRAWLEGMPDGADE